MHKSVFQGKHFEWALWYRLQITKVVNIKLTISDTVPGPFLAIQPLSFWFLQLESTYLLESNLTFFEELILITEWNILLV